MESIGTVIKVFIKCSQNVIIEFIQNYTRDKYK